MKEFVYFGFYCSTGWQLKTFFFCIPEGGTIVHIFSFSTITGSHGSAQRDGSSILGDVDLMPEALGVPMAQ